MSLRVWLCVCLSACTAPQSDDGKEPDTDSDTDTDVVETPYALEEGKYLVEAIETPDNDCSADFSYMLDRTLRMWVDGDNLDIEGIPLQRDVNRLSGTESERRDWSGIGADCITDIEYLYTGEVVAEGRFTWDWDVTWSYAGGEGCDEALGHPLPCTYWGLFTMAYQGPLSD